MHQLQQTYIARDRMDENCNQVHSTGKQAATRLKAEVN